jgi:hypothetical protein
MSVSSAYQLTQVLLQFKFKPKHTCTCIQSSTWWACGRDDSQLPPSPPCSAHSPGTELAPSPAAKGQQAASMKGEAPGAAVAAAATDVPGAPGAATAAASATAVGNRAGGGGDPLPDPVFTRLLLLLALPAVAATSCAATSGKDASLGVSSAAPRGALSAATCACCCCCCCCCCCAPLSTVPPSTSNAATAAPTPPLLPSPPRPPAAAAAAPACGAWLLDPGAAAAAVTRSRVASLLAGGGLRRRGGTTGDICRRMAGRLGELPVAATVGEGVRGRSRTSWALSLLMRAAVVGVWGQQQRQQGRWWEAGSISWSEGHEGEGRGEQAWLLVQRFGEGNT